MIKILTNKFYLDRHLTIFILVIYSLEISSLPTSLLEETKNFEKLKVKEKRVNLPQRNEFNQKWSPRKAENYNQDFEKFYNLNNIQTDDLNKNYYKIYDKNKMQDAPNENYYKNDFYMDSFRSDARNERTKRELELNPEDVLALLSIWETERDRSFNPQRNTIRRHARFNKYPPNNYDDEVEDDIEDYSDEKWYDKPVNPNVEYYNVEKSPQFYKYQTENANMNNNHENQYEFYDQLSNPRNKRFQRFQMPVYRNKRHRLSYDFHKNDNWKKFLKNSLKDKYGKNKIKYYQ